MMRFLFLIPPFAAAVAALMGYGLSGSAILRGHLLGVTGIAVIGLCAGLAALLVVTAAVFLRLSRRFEQLRADLADYEFAVGLRLSRLETGHVQDKPARPESLPSLDALPVVVPPTVMAAFPHEGAETAEKGNVVSLETAQRDRAQQERRLRPRTQETDKAIVEGRFEAWFQPVVSLPLRKTVYLVAVPYLPVSRGAAQPHEEWSRAAARLGRASTVDQQMLLQGIKLVRDLRRKEKPCAVIWRASRATLQDGQRFQEVIELLRANSALRDLIVCEIGLSDYRQCKAEETERLFALREAGCRLCLGGSTDILAIAKALRTGIFALATVDARAIIDGAASDIATAGLEPGTEIIATGVSSEADAIALIDFEIGLAVGPLFSPPRPLKRDLGASGAP